MPTIGRLEYPEVSFSDALDTIEKIKSKNIKTIHGLAEELGYSTKSKSPGGTFYYKLVALDGQYGLIQRERGNLTLSPLGQRIAYPLNDADRAAAINESLQRVEILRSLFKDLGVAYHDSDFRPKLRELTGAPPDQIAAQATRIENLYKDALQYMSAASLVLPSEPSPAPMLNASSALQAPPSGGRRSPKIDLGSLFETAFKDPNKPVRTLHSEDGYYIRVVLDTNVIDEAIAVLEALKKRIPP
jgi:hypothetical protein